MALLSGCGQFINGTECIGGTNTVVNNAGVGSYGSWRMKSIGKVVTLDTNFKLSALASTNTIVINLDKFTTGQTSAGVAPPLAVASSARAVAHVCANGVSSGHSITSVASTSTAITVTFAVAVSSNAPRSIMLTVSYTAAE